ncbi:putative RNA-directed DNA polymerase [Helianthus annuus]|nr:putative RNA-directed DNA polymerase [Helianthus annuus]
MNFVSININGVTDRRKGLWIRKIKRQVKADFVGIQETHQAGLSDFAIRSFWDRSNMCAAAVDSVGRSGGLLSIWNPDVFTVDQVVKNQRFLLLSGVLSGVDGRVNVIKLHAPNDPVNRRSLWADLLELIGQSMELWILLGDFNDVRSEEERVNWRFDRGAMEAFNGFIDNAGLLEFPMAGGKFTYISGHKDIKFSKLDRFLVSEAVMNTWPNARVEVHKRSLSDHCPISLFVSAVDFGPVPFKFFNSWTNDKKLSEIVDAVLRPTGEGAAGSSLGVDPFSDLVGSLKQVKMAIKKWRKEAAALENKELKEMVDSIDKIEHKALSQQLSDEEKSIRIDLRLKVDKLELKMASDLHQKARANWINFGDENSAYFHKIISVNVARNRISGLLFNDRFITDPYELKDEIRSWFKKLFSETIRCRPDFSGSGVPSIPVHLSSSLCDSFSEAEVLQAIKSCDGGKAPGPDGFTLKFFKVFWSKLKPWVLSFLNEFHRSGSIGRGYNSSFIALIPKSKDPIEIANFRPISLVSSFYKILAKMLANRLKLVMDGLSSPTQSAFVGGRNILDSPLIMSEIVTWAKKSKKKLLILKVDFEKAYDSINWKFLLRIMEKMAFPDKWICWIRSCLVSGRVSVLVNGSPTKEFNFKRGLRQGDPLSPFLFVIAMEIISILMNRACNSGLFEGCQLPNGGPLISHLCYADDVLFIGAWSEDNAANLNRILR